MSHYKLNVFLFLLFVLQYETGWRFKKRPGVDFLLHHCAPPLFEIVIYTNEQGFVGTNFLYY